MSIMRWHSCGAQEAPWLLPFQKMRTFTWGLLRSMDTQLNNICRYTQIEVIALIFIYVHCTAGATVRISHWRSSRHHEPREGRISSRFFPKAFRVKPSLKLSINTLRSRLLLWHALCSMAGAAVPISDLGSLRHHSSCLSTSRRSGIQSLFLFQKLSSLNHPSNFPPIHSDRNYFADFHCRCNRSRLSIRKFATPPRVCSSTSRGSRFQKLFLQKLSSWNDPSNYPSIHSDRSYCTDLHVRTLYGRCNRSHHSLRKFETPRRVCLSTSRRSACARTRASTLTSSYEVRRRRFCRTVFIVRVYFMNAFDLNHRARTNVWHFARMSALTDEVNDLLQFISGTSSTKRVYLASWAWG